MIYKILSSLKMSIAKIALLTPFLLLPTLAFAATTNIDTVLQNLLEGIRKVVSLSKNCNQRQ